MKYIGKQIGTGIKYLFQLFKISNSVQSPINCLLFLPKIKLHTKVQFLYVNKTINKHAISRREEPTTIIDINLHFKPREKKIAHWFHLKNQTESVKYNALISTVSDPNPKKELCFDYYFRFLWLNMLYEDIGLRGARLLLKTIKQK